MKFLLSKANVIIGFIIFIAVLLLLVGLADNFSYFLSYDFLTSIMPRQDINFVSKLFGLIKGTGLFDDYISMDVPKTSTEVACMMAKEIRDDFVEYGMNKDHYGVSFGEINENLEMISGEPQEFQIKRRVSVEFLEENVISYDSRTIIGDYITVDDIPTKNEVELKLIYENSTYWSYEDLPEEMKDKTKELCSDTGEFIPCPTSYIDEECVTGILANLKVGNIIFCTGLNKGTTQFFIGGTDEVHFGNNAYISKEKFDKGSVSDPTKTDEKLCPPGTGYVSGEEDMISVWKTYGAVEIDENIYSEYTGDDFYLSDGGFPPYKYYKDDDGIIKQIKDDAIYSWTVLWNKESKKYEIWIPKMTKKKKLIGVQDTDTIKTELLKAYDTIERSTDVGAFPEFRIKSHLIVKLDPNKDPVYLQTFLDGFVAETKFKEKWYDHIKCEGDECKIPPGGTLVFNEKDGYKYYTRIEAFSWNTRAVVGGDPSKWTKTNSGEWEQVYTDSFGLHVRSELDLTDYLYNDKEYEFILIDWESRTFERTTDCTGGTGIDAWYQVDDTKFDSEGDVIGLFSPKCHDDAGVGDYFVGIASAAIMKLQGRKIYSYKFTDHALVIIERGNIKDFILPFEELENLETDTPADSQ